MEGIKGKNWHPADIIAGIKKSGTSLAALSRQHGLSSGTLANALNKPWPKGEWIIATQLGTSPASIWPERYHDLKGQRLNRHPNRESPQQTTE